MLNYIKKLMKNQFGFTAVELLIGVAIIGIIGGSIGVTVAQTYNGSTLSSKHMTAINNVKNAVDWITRDAEQARPKESATGSGELVAATPPDDKITLIWYDYKNDNYSVKEWYRVIYTIPENTTSLQRTYETGTYTTATGFVKDPNISLQSVVVAQNITSVTRQFKDCIWSADLNPVCLQAVNVMTINITSSVSGVEETRTSEIEFRPIK
jgi:prepilin-type N-terminal cleavage/methylation domain-containing protein